MIVESKFNIEQEVYYWSLKNVKVRKGTITGISLSVHSDSDIRVRYWVRPVDNKIEFSEDVPEHLVFRLREDVFEFCMKLTEGI